MENMKKQLDQYLDDSLFYYDLPGLAVLVQRDQIEYANAVGYKDFVEKKALKEEHIFHVASVSKLFTATGILQLREKGLLKLTDKLLDLLPYVHIEDKRSEEIQVIHMLTHTSGLGDVEDYHWEAENKSDTALKDFACSDLVSQPKLLWSPLENKFRYSNPAYELLGQVISEISGLSYEAYMKKFIFDPLEMRSSTFSTFERAGGSLDLQDLSSANMAMPHKKDEKNHIILEEHYPYNRQHAPSSTLTTNIRDLAKWGRAHLDQSLFSKETYQEIWTRYANVPNNNEGMGLGWFIRHQNGFELYGHEGNDDGFRASFWICPQLNTQVVVAANILKTPAKKISKELFDLVTHS